jgi:hypothetical protein
MVVELDTAGAALAEPQLGEPGMVVRLAEDAEDLAEHVAVVVDAERDARIGADIGDRHDALGRRSRLRARGPADEGGRQRGRGQRGPDRDRERLATNHDTPPELVPIHAESPAHRRSPPRGGRSRACAAFDGPRGPAPTLARRASRAAPCFGDYRL